MSNDKMADSGSSGDMPLSNDGNLTIDDSLTADECQENSSLQANCRPCLQKSDENPAVTWCTICHETFCNSCNTDHAMLADTKSHIVISFSEYTLSENSGSYSGSFNTYLAGETPPDSLIGIPIDVELKRSFYVQKRERYIELIDVEVLPNGDLAILETFKPRLLIYDRSGSPKKGEVTLPGVPSCLTLYHENKVAVTIPEMQTIAIVSTWFFMIEFYIAVYDYCYGICMLDNYLIVNCVNHGLKSIDIWGHVFNVTSKIRGKLYICSGNNGDLFTMKANSRMIICYNIYNRKRSRFDIKGFKNPTGITVNDENTLLVACINKIKVYGKHDGNDHTQTIITDRLDEPSSLSYDKNNKELVVINNSRRSVFTFYLEYS